MKKWNKFEIAVAVIAISLVCAGTVVQIIEPHRAAKKAEVKVGPVQDATNPTTWKPEKFKPFKNEAGNLVTASGPVIAGSCSNDGSYGSVAWSNPGNVTADDAADATISNNDSVSNYLKTDGYNHGFAIGMDQVIDGIEVHVCGKCTGGARDESVKLVIGGAITGTDQKTNTAWTGSYATYTFGGPTNKWGVSDIYPMQVNDSSFGCVFSSAMSDVTDTMSVDFIAMTIYHHTDVVTDADVGVMDNPASAWWYAEYRRIKSGLFDRPLFDPRKLWTPRPIFQPVSRRIISREMVCVHRRGQLAR